MVTPNLAAILDIVSPFATMYTCGVGAGGTVTSGLGVAFTPVLGAGEVPAAGPLVPMPRNIGAMKNRATAASTSAIAARPIRGTPPRLGSPIRVRSDG